MNTINILLTGCNGRMGRFIVDTVKKSSNQYRIAAGIDINPSAGQAYESFPIYASLSDFNGEADVLIDFSHHTAVLGILNYCKAHKLPAIIATTGNTSEELEAMKEASAFIPVFHSGNMSLGINVLISLCRKAAAALGEGFDIEIIEKHHNQKLDAPSGTALMLADAVSEELPYEPEYTYERQSRREIRPKHEIGIHSVRGGTIVGEHEVMFAGSNEVITLSHSAESREVFAHGALRAAKFLVGKPAGFYNMNDVIDG